MTASLPMSSDRPSLQNPDSTVLTHDSFQDFFAGLSGDWQLIRQVSDGSRFEGSARFADFSENSYRLEETGKLVLRNSETLSAMREWVWICSDDGQLEIRYSAANGGGLYHHVELAVCDSPEGQSFQGKASHYCGKDIYTGMYHLAENSLNIRHEISGPKKELVIRSHFSR